METHFNIISNYPHFKVQDVRKNIWTTINNRITRLYYIREYHRFRSKVLPQKFGAFDSQLTESTFEKERSAFSSLYLM